MKITSTPGRVWDAGNIDNGFVNDGGSATWDFVATNLVWNNVGANVPFTDGNGAIFAGADGAYGIKLAANVSAPVVTFVSSGYALTNDTPQTVTVNSVSTATPKFTIAAGK